MRIRSFIPRSGRARTQVQSGSPSAPARVLRRLALGLAVSVSVALPVAAAAQVKIGLVLSLTGPAASLGIPARDTVALFPKEVAGQKVEYLVFDDASDTTQAVQNTKKLISEEHVDAIIGSSITPNSLAMLDVISQGETPTISLAW